MAWHEPGDKPLSATMMVRLPTHINIIPPQWVHAWRYYYKIGNFNKNITQNQFFPHNQIISTNKFPPIFPTHNGSHFYPRAVFAYGYWLCMGVCLHVCQCVSTPTLSEQKVMTCSSYKYFLQKLQNTTMVKIPILFEVHWPWTSRWNLSWRCTFMSPFPNTVNTTTRINTKPEFTQSNTN